MGCRRAKTPGTLVPRQAAASRRVSGVPVSPNTGSHTYHGDGHLAHHQFAGFGVVGRRLRAAGGGGAAQGVAATARVHSRLACGLL